VFKKEKGKIVVLNYKLLRDKEKLYSGHSGKPYANLERYDFIRRRNINIQTDVSQSIIKMYRGLFFI